MLLKENQEDHLIKEVLEDLKVLKRQNLGESQEDQQVPKEKNRVENLEDQLVPAEESQEEGLDDHLVLKGKNLGGNQDDLLAPVKEGREDLHLDLQVLVEGQEGLKVFKKVNLEENLENRQV